MTSRASWRFSDGALLAGLVALAVAATWPVWSEVFTFAWHDEEQSHILLAPFIAAWLVWVRRARFRLCRPAPTITGPLIMLVAAAVCWYGFRFKIDLCRHGGALGVVVGAGITVLGWGVVRKFWPALFVLAFLLPIPGRIRHPVALYLQEWTAAVAHFGLDLFAVPVERDANVLRINGVDVAVAEACNGMRMVAALGLVTFAFVFSVPMRNFARAVILLFSPLIALIVNVIRLVPTVLLYGYQDVKVANLFHDISGWVMLFVALGVLWCVLALLRWLQVPITPYAIARE